MTRRPPERAEVGSRLLPALLALTCFACAQTPAAEPPTVADAGPEITLRVMTFNVEYGGTGVDFAKVIEAIERAAPDVVGLEEPEANTREIAAALGFGFDARSDVISRFPILDPPGADGRFVLVEVRPARVVAVANVHLPSDPYGPYWIAEGRSRDEVLELERSLRLPKLEPTLRALLGLRDVPAFLVGDFNAPSHLDWRGDAGDGQAERRVAVDWPVSRAVERAGFVDSYRSVHPDPRRTPGHSWWAARPPGGDDFTGDPQDRIDFVYAAGAARPVASQLVGEPGARDVDIDLAPWPSDHRAVVSTFRVTPAPMPRLVAVDGQRLIDVGEPLEVQYHAPGDSLRIALLPSDGEVAAGPPPASPAVASGRGSLRLPTGELAPGHYEVALLADDGEVLSRAPVRVKAPGEATRVGVDRDSYASGEPIAIHWSNGPGHRWDWVGILPEAAGPSMENYLVWRHTDTRIDGEVRIDRADSQDQRWPLPPGGYRVLYLLQDTVKSVAQARFEVRAAGADERAR